MGKSALLALAFLLVGCPKPTQNYFLGPAAPSAAVASQKSFVYIARSFKYFAGAASFPIVVNGETMGVLGSRRYVVYEVPPGPVLLQAKSEAPGQVFFEAAPGQAYYFTLEAMPGWLLSRAQLTPISPEEGADMVSRFPQSADPRKTTIFFP